jgi:hypothetical protein
MIINSKVNIFNTLLALFVFLLLSTFSKAQGIEEMAVDLIENERYEEALSHFEELTRLYPGEHMFQYYYGLCLTQTGNYGDKARTCLLRAAQGDVPADVDFYIGKNYHALNDFETAHAYYNRFDDYARRRDKRSVNFKDVIQALENGLNPFLNDTQTDAETPEKIVEEIIQTDEPVSINDTLQQDTEAPDSTNNNLIPIVKEAKKELTKIPHELENTNINFILSPELKYLRAHQFKTEEGKSLYISGWEKDRAMQNALNRLNTLREEYKRISDSEKKQGISQKMLELELDAIRLKAESDENFLLARSTEMEYWRNAPQKEIENLEDENESIQLSEAELEAEEKKEEELEEQETEEQEIEEEEEEEEVTTPEGNSIVYKIQIGAYSKGLPEYIDRLYKKLSVLRRIDSYTGDKGVVVYTVGELANFDDAVKLQNQIRQEGVKDAFVVAFNNGKRITLSEAREISKQ